MRMVEDAWWDRAQRLLRTVKYILLYETMTIPFSSVVQSCLTLCDPMNRSMPGLPVHHQLTEITQTHVHRVSDSIQPSHPLSSPSPPDPNPSQHQGFSNESTLCMRWPKYWSFANQNYKEILPHTSQNVNHQHNPQTINAGESVERRNPSTLLVGM